MKTEEKIISKALEMFNQRGIEYVGLRELASVLQIRVSNITYYFPKKDDLVNRLSMDLNKLNSEVVVENEHLTMLTFLEMFHKVFQNHVKYRCLLLSLVHILEQNKVISEKYKNTQRTRNETMKLTLIHLQQTGYLNSVSENKLHFLVSMLSLIARFWISEATVSFRNLSRDEQIRHYLILIVELFYPYCTETGKE